MKTFSSRSLVDERDVFLGMIFWPLLKVDVCANAGVCQFEYAFRHAAVLLPKYNDQVSSK